MSILNTPSFRRDSASSLSRENLRRLQDALERKAVLPLMTDAEAVWDREYPTLLDHKPWLFPDGIAAAKITAIRWATLAATDRCQSAIDADAFHAGLFLWQYGYRQVSAPQVHGIVFNSKTRTVFWSGNYCRFHHVGPFTLFQAFVRAHGVALSPRAISDHLDPKSSHTSAALRMAIYRLKKTLRKCHMQRLADALVADGNSPGSYKFDLSKKPR